MNSFIRLSLSFVCFCVSFAFFVCIIKIFLLIIGYIKLQLYSTSNTIDLYREPIIFYIIIGYFIAAIIFFLIAEYLWDVLTKQDKRQDKKFDSFFLKLFLAFICFCISVFCTIKMTLTAVRYICWNWYDISDTTNLYSTSLVYFVVLAYFAGSFIFFSIAKYLWDTLME